LHELLGVTLVEGAGDKQDDVVDHVAVPVHIKNKK